MRLDMVLKGENVAQVIALGEAICHMADGMEPGTDRNGGVQDLVEFDIAGVPHILRAGGRVFTKAGERRVLKRAELVIKVTPKYPDDFPHGPGS